ncbi:MAG: hypothetical protein HRU20_18555 [Pseudomonadales bacterium]|nr:hypothetical protein [Pseudomonadales bacterium]
MALSIATNISSLQIQRYLDSSRQSLDISMQRLSTGLRINSASDDAAGLSIAQRFTSQITGLNQAVRNANDGISLIQTAEGSVNTINQNLQRIRELALQALNDSQSQSDRMALNQEVQQRLAEINRIATQTSFNNKKLLDGSYSKANFQIGPQVGDVFTLDSISSMRGADLGRLASAISNNLTTVLAAGGTVGTFTSGVIADFDFSTSNISRQGISLGAFTEGDDDNLINDYFHQWIVTPGVQLDIAVNNLDTSVSSTVVADAMAAAFVGQGFAADGSGQVGGFSLDLGAETSIANAISNGSLSVYRLDDQAFSYFTGSSGYSVTAPAFATPTATNSSPLNISDESNNKSITVDGFNINLNGSNETDAINQLQAQLDAQASGDYLVTGNGGGNITIEKTAVGSSSLAPVIAGTDTTLFTTGSTSVNGTGSAAFTVAGDFQVQFGDGPILSVADGIYTEASDILAAIEAAVQDYASVLLNSDNSVSITSPEPINFFGNAALVRMGYSSSYSVSSQLANISVLTIDAANNAVLHVDSALEQALNLRTMLGASQNRLDSIINTQLASIESQSAARGRIVDADYAVETSNLTRMLILQQAGIAVLAQANIQPQLALILLA